MHRLALHRHGGVDGLDVLRAGTRLRSHSDDPRVTEGCFNELLVALLKNTLKTFRGVQFQDIARTRMTRRREARRTESIKNKQTSFAFRGWLQFGVSRCAAFKDRGKRSVNTREADCCGRRVDKMECKPRKKKKKRNVKG